MEKEALTEKEKYLIILLCVLGATSAFYTGICHYAGWIGKMEYFQYQFIIVAGKDVFFCPAGFFTAYLPGCFLFCAYMGFGG